MYIGRMIALGRSTEGTPFAGYRVSSRSFPDRHAIVKGESIYVAPRNREDLEKSPYISYPCIKIAGEYAVVANGEHSEAIAAHLFRGKKPFNAVTEALSEAGPEHDAHNTPRIAGILCPSRGIIGIVQSSGLNVKEFELEKALMVATYEKTAFEAIKIEGKNAREIALTLYELEFDLPVCTACAVSKEKAFELGVYNGRISGE